MKTIKTLLTVFFAFLGISSVCLYGADIPFRGLDKSNHISGPEVTQEMMKGKVVLFDYWGLGCPPCHASMPKLEALWQKYGDKYLIIHRLPRSAFPSFRRAPAIHRLCALPQACLSCRVWSCKTVCARRPSGQIYAILRTSPPMQLHLF